MTKHTRCSNALPSRLFTMIFQPETLIRCDTPHRDDKSQRQERFLDAKRDTSLDNGL